MSESTSLQHDSPEAAEAAFYAAFEARDFAAMQRIWSASDDTLCVHPSGPALRGWAAISRSWQMIFDSLGEVRFTLSNLQAYNDDTLSVRFVYENIHHGADFSRISRVLATNVFRREASGWKLISHHGSPGGTVEVPPDPPTPRATH